MNVYIKNKTVDAFGIIIGGLCALHCALLPILAILFPLISTSHNHGLHTGIIILVVILGGWTCLLNKTRKSSWVGIAIGIPLLLFAEYGIENEVFSSLTMVLGGTLLILTHYKNWKSSKISCCAREPNLSH